MKNEKVKTFRVKVRKGIPENESKNGHFFMEEMYQNGKILIVEINENYVNIYKEVKTSKPAWGYHKDWLIFIDEETLFQFE